MTSPADVKGREEVKAGILSAARLLMAPGGVHEVRILNTRKGTVSGYFDDPEKLAETVPEWDGEAPAIYVSLNPTKPDLLARANNRLREYARETTADSDILNRQLFPIDCDPRRPSGISSTDAEHALAMARAKAIGKYLGGLGWPQPFLADSGNGAHLGFRIHLANDPESAALLSRCLKALDLLFSDEGVKIDADVFNAARIWKLYGTMACKGDSIPGRPHRRSRIVWTPDPFETVPVELLRDLANMMPAQEPRAASNGHLPHFDIDRFIRDHLKVAREGPWQGGRKWVLSECPFNSEHQDRAACVVQFPSGAIAARCPP